MSRHSRWLRSVKGFTLVELAVVIVIIGVLAAFGVPRFLKSVERSKAAEAFGYLSAVCSAQERYIAREGTYADNISKLDISNSPPKYFTLPEGGTISAGPVTADGGTATIQNSWSMTLTRGTPNGGYGNYTVVFTQQGYDSSSTIEAIPAINPMAGSTTNTGGGGS